MRLDLRESGLAADAAKCALTHLRNYFARVQEGGCKEPPELGGQFAAVRRLEAYLRKRLEAFGGGGGELYLDEEGRNLLAACLVHYAAELEHLILSESVTPDQRRWIEEKVRLGVSLASGLMTRPIRPILHPDPISMNTPSVRRFHTGEVDRRIWDTYGSMNLRDTEGSGTSKGKDTLLFGAGKTLERGGDPVPMMLPPGGGREGGWRCSVPSITPFPDSGNEGPRRAEYAEEGNHFPVYPKKIGVGTSVPSWEESAASDLEGKPEAQGPPEFRGRTAPQSPPPTPLDSGFRAALIHDHRVRAQVKLDLRSYRHAKAQEDLRLCLVHLGSLFESILLDHGLAHRSELELTEAPNRWNFSDLARKIFGERLEAGHEPILALLQACRKLLRPAVMLVHPIVVTGTMVAEAEQFLAWLLHELGYSGGEERVVGERPPRMSGIWKVTRRIEGD